MENVNKSVSLPVSKEAAWDLLADFGNPHEYFEGITGARLTSAATEGVGMSRHCDLPPKMGMKQYIDEEITDWKPGEEFTYIVTGTAAPIKNGIVTWRVSGDQHNSEIHVFIKYDPAGLMGQVMKSMLRKEFNKQMDVGLASIKTLFEKQQLAGADSAAAS